MDRLISVSGKADTLTHADVTSIKAQLIEAFHKNEIGNVRNRNGVVGWLSCQAAWWRGTGGSALFTHEHKRYIQVMPSALSFSHSCAHKVDTSFAFIRQYLIWLCGSGTGWQWYRMAPGGTAIGRWFVLEQGTICTLNVRSWYKMWLKLTGNNQLYLLFFVDFDEMIERCFIWTFYDEGLARRIVSPLDTQLCWTLEIARRVGTIWNLGRCTEPLRSFSMHEWLRVE